MRYILWFPAIVEGEWEEVFVTVDAWSPDSGFNERLYVVKSCSVHATDATLPLDLPVSLLSLRHGRSKTQAGR